MAHRRRWLDWPVAICALSITVAIVVPVIFADRWNEVRSACTVASHASDAQVTFRGIGSSTICDGFTSNMDEWTRLAEDLGPEDDLLVACQRRDGSITWEARAGDQRAGRDACAVVEQWIWEQKIILGPRVDS